MGATINTFENGMLLDSIESLQPKGTYRYARNAINKSRDARGFGLVNEESNELVASFGGKIRGKSFIEERNQTLYFIDSGASELWLFNHNDNSTEFVCSDVEFGCNWGFAGCEFLYGEFKQFNGCNELHVYWSSDCIYHVVNIDEMLDPTRKAAVKMCEDCEYFDVFKVTCGPHQSALPAHNGGSTLEAGVIQFAVQFEDNDGNTSNIFDISEQVKIESEDNKAGQIGTTSARLVLSGLDNRWNSVIIYVIHTVGGVTNIYKMPSRGFSDRGLTFEYYGQEGDLVDVSVLINRNKAFLRGMDLIQKDGRMFFYNIKNERNLNYQQYANNIDVEWVEYEVTLDQMRKYNFPSLMRGEVYALGIVFKYNDGTYSHVFHIPGCPGGSISESSDDNDYGKAAIVVGKGSGSTGPIADGGKTFDPSASDTYNPVRASDFDTSNQFRRERNPSEVKDRPNESDKLENATRQDIANIDAREEDYIEVSECLACTRECWCDNDNCCLCGATLVQQCEGGEECTTVINCDQQEDEQCDCSVVPRIVEADIHDVSNTVQNAAELISLFGKDYPDPDVNRTGNLHDAALDLVDNAVTEREYITRKRPVLNYSGSNQSGPGSNPQTPDGSLLDQPTQFTQKNVGVSNITSPVGKGASIRGDNWVDDVGNNLTDEPPRIVNSGSTIPWISEVEYPDDKDCDGNFFYPQRNVCHHEMPGTDTNPHFVSYQNGVENQYQPDNDPYGKTYIRMMGLRFNNVKIPDQDDLPKPLCPHSPFKFVYVKRTDHNKRVFAKGWCSGMFLGENHGSEYLFPRHGVNSFETVDRTIAAGGDGLSRKGSHYDDGAYTFHSPDTDCDNSYLPVTHVKPELTMLGSGWRYGLYAEGRQPQGDQFSGTKVDQRGARVANNINHYVPAGGGNIGLKGITYAPANTVITAPSGVQYPLMNRFRERSVYFEVDSQLPGSDRDQSFVGDVLDHFAPTTANAPYVALVRDIPDQYGSVENLQYIDLGIRATSVHINGGKSIEGICGDVWIGPYSKRRTSYVSNKVGDFYNVPNKPGSPCRERSICDSPDDKIFQYFGIDYYPTRLPESGDIYDPKNYAGLHTVAGGCGDNGLSRTAGDAAGQDDSESDYYWPRTLKSLVHCIVESHVNPFLRETGEGSQIEQGRVYYPKLKDLYLDSDAPSQHPWEESFLNRFYCAVEQPSKKQLAKKALIRTVLNMLAPAALLTQFQNMETVIDTVSTFVVFPMLAALWTLATNTLFTDRRLNQMLGIGDCLRDEEGGDLDECIEQFEDAYSAYNYDYSKPNELYPYYAFPLPYNTCDCNDCQKDQTNNEIYHSNKQNLDSELDAYRNVKINNYKELPAHAGNLQRLFILNGQMFAHTTDGIWLIKYAPASFSNQIAFQQAGSGELLAEPQLLFEGVSEGFAGTEHPNAAINTVHGYFFIDDNAKKVYRFNGSPEEISAYGMFNFFKENLGFCEGNECYDEKTEFGVHYSMGWDHRYNRLLLTKQDGNECSSWTISYDPTALGDSGAWISFHSYLPQDYAWDRNNFYSILADKGEVWRHHVKGDYTTFYGEKYDFMVSFSASIENRMAFDAKHFEIDADSELETDKNYPIKGTDEIFNKIALWNNTEGTGTRDVILISDDAGKRKSVADRIEFNPSKIRLHKVRRKWRSNDMFDLIKDGCEYKPLLKTDCGCQAIPDIDESLYSCDNLKKQEYIGRHLSDNHLNYRLVLDNRNDLRIKLKSVITYEDTPQLTE